MATRFFVCGAMSEGMVHWSKISEMIENKEPAQIRAKAWRLKVGYPVLTNEPDQVICGHMVALKSSDLLVHLLDEFHGYNQFHPERSLFLREEAQAMTSSGFVTCWVYFLNPKKRPAGTRLIEDGDWARSLAEEPALTGKLTDRQKEYLSRLGAATGREIVPIHDMTLYRELMNLDLIVDKGRRLALSKFGQEVVRYLG